MDTNEPSPVAVATSAILTAALKQLVTKQLISLDKISSEIEKANALQPHFKLGYNMAKQLIEKLKLDE